MLYNDASDPLLIENLSLTNLPPEATYVHGQSTAVPIRFKYSNPPYWAAGDVLGYLTLAGHGVIHERGHGDGTVCRRNGARRAFGSNLGTRWLTHTAAAHSLAAPDQLVPDTQYELQFGCEHGGGFLIRNNQCSG